MLYHGTLLLEFDHWTRARCAAVITAIVGVVIVTWRRLVRTIELKRSLVGGDGRTAMIKTANGLASFVAVAVIAAAKPTTLPRGADASAPFAASFVRPELPPDSYAFTVSEAADGEIARLPFEVDE